MTSDRVQTTIALFAGIQLPVPDGGEKGETSDFARVFAGMMGSATPGDGMADSSGKSGMASGTLGFASRAGETEILSGSGRVTSDNGVPAGMETIALSADSGVVRDTVQPGQESPKAAMIAATPARAVISTDDARADDSTAVEAPIMLFAFPAAASDFIPGGETDAENGTVVVPVRIESARFEEDGEVLVFTAVIADTSAGAETTVTFTGAADIRPGSDAVASPGSTVEIETAFRPHIPSGAGAGTDDGGGMPVPPETVPAAVTKEMNVLFAANMRSATAIGTGAMKNDTIPTETAGVGRNAFASGTESATGPVVSGIAADGMKRASTESTGDANGGPRRIRIEFILPGERTDGASVRNDTVGNGSDASSRAAITPEKGASTKLPVTTADAGGQTSPVIVTVVEASSSEVAAISGAEGSAKGLAALLLSFAETGPVEAVFRIAPDAAPKQNDAIVIPGEMQKTVTVQPVENDVITASSATNPIEGDDVPKQPGSFAAGSSVTEPPGVRERTALRFERVARMRDTVQTDRRVSVEDSAASESTVAAKPAPVEATALSNATADTVYSGETVANNAQISVNRAAQIKSTVMNPPAPEEQAVSAGSAEETASASVNRAARVGTVNVASEFVDNKTIPEVRVVRMYSQPGGTRSTVADSETVQNTMQPVAAENEQPVSISRPAEPPVQPAVTESAAKTVVGPIHMRVKTVTISENESGAETRSEAAGTPAGEVGRVDRAGSKTAHTVSSASGRAHTPENSGTTAVRPAGPDVIGESIADSDNALPSMKTGEIRNAAAGTETVTVAAPEAKERPRSLAGTVPEGENTAPSSEDGTHIAAGEKKSSTEARAAAPRMTAKTAETDADKVITEPRNVKSNEAPNNNSEPVKIERSGRVDVRAGSSDGRNASIPLSAVETSSKTAGITDADAGASDPVVVSTASRGEMDAVTAGDDRIRLVRVPGNAVEMESGSPSVGNSAERGNAPSVRRIAPPTAVEYTSTADASSGAHTVESESSANSAQAAPSPTVAGEGAGITDISSRTANGTTAVFASVSEAGKKSGRRSGSAVIGMEETPSINTVQQENIISPADGSASSTGGRLTDQRGGESRDADTANVSSRSESASGEQASVFVPTDRQVRTTANERGTSRREQRIEKNESRRIAATSTAATDSGRDADIVTQDRPVSTSVDMNTAGRSRVSDLSGNAETMSQTASADTGPGLFAAGTEKTGMTQESRKTAEPAHTGSGMSRYHDIESGVMTTVVRQARILLQNRQSSATMVLEPPSLGRMTLDIVTENAKLTGKITVESREVQDIIRSNIADLRQTLAQNGYMVESFDVQVGHNGGTDSWARREDFENLAAMADADRKTYVGEASVNDEYGEPAIRSGWSAGTVDIWI